MEANHNKSDALDRLWRAFVKTGIKAIDRRNFYGQKVAREVMEELGMAGILDESAEAAFGSMMGTCVTTGIVLAMRKTTDIPAIEAEIQRLFGKLPDELVATQGEEPLENLITYLIPCGITFYDTDLSQNSPKVQTWHDEFELLYNLES